MFERLWHSPTFTTWGKFSTRFLGLFLVLPLILKFFDPQEVACYYLFVTVATISGFIEGGFSTTYTRVFSYANAGATSLREKDRKGDGNPNVALLAQLLSLTGRVQLISVSILALGLGVIGTLSLIKPISACPDPASVWVGWGLYAISAVIRAFGARNLAAVKGVGQIAAANRWEILFGSLGLVATAIVLVSGGGFVGLGVVQVLAAALAFHRYRWLRKTVNDGVLREGDGSDWDPEMFREIWEPTWRQMIVILLTTGMVQASGLLLAQLREGVDLAGYLLALRLMTVVSQMSQAPFYAHIPALSALRGKGEIAGLAKRSGVCLRRSLLTFIIGATAVGVAAPIGLDVIGSETRFVPTLFWILLSGIWMLERHHAMHAQIVVTANKVPFVASVAVTGCLQLILMLSLAPKYAGWGLLIAHGAANLVLNNWWIVLMSLRSLGEFARTNVRVYLLPALGAAALGLLCLWWLEPLLRGLLAMLGFDI